MTFCSTDRKLATISGDGAVCRIGLSVDLPASTDAVWRALTQVDALRVWWPDWRSEQPGVFDQHVGGCVRIGDGAWLDGLIKQWCPPTLLEFSWHETKTDEALWFEPQTKSLVRVDLTPQGEGCLLNFVQFCKSEACVGAAAGWHQLLGEHLLTYLKQGQALEPILEEPILEEEGRFEALKALYR